MSKPNSPVPTSSQWSNGGSQEGEKKAAYVNYEVEPDFTIRLRHNFDPAIHPTKLERIVSNSVAAQKSRWKKRRYVDNLVKKTRELQWQASVLRSQLEMVSEQKRCLEREQMELKESISAWSQYLISQQEMEARRTEIERLMKKKMTLSD